MSCDFAALSESDDYQGEEHTEIKTGVLSENIKIHSLDHSHSFKLPECFPLQNKWFKIRIMNELAPEGYIRLAH